MNATNATCCCDIPVESMGDETVCANCGGKLPLLVQAGQMVMRGPCAKRRVICVIEAPNGRRFVGENDCTSPQPECPRAPGEGYEKCKTVCGQAGHAEIEAVKAAGPHARGARATIIGHYWICEPCGAALRDAGVSEVRIVREWTAEDEAHSGCPINAGLWER